MGWSGLFSVIHFEMVQMNPAVKETTDHVLWPLCAGEDESNIADVKNFGEVVQASSLLLSYLQPLSSQAKTRGANYTKIQ